jgi:hypothetical protein
MPTPHEAASLLCPFAQTFGVKEAFPGCRGPECALWRWEKVTTAHPDYVALVRANADANGEKPPYKNAARFVADNLVALGLTPTRGFCGAGGAE